MTTAQAPGAASIISAVSIEALLAARDAAQAAFKESVRLLDQAKEQVGVFGVELPRVSVHFPDGNPADIQDPRNATAIEQEIDRHFWLRLYVLTQIDTIMDHKTRGELFEQLHRSRGFARFTKHAPADLPALTRENIEATIAAVHAQRGEYFERCVEAVYRSLSWEHRTNEPTRIGEKLIVNHAFYLHPRSLQGDTASLSSHESLHDLERVLCLLAGLPPSGHGVGLRWLGPIPFGKWIDVPSPLGPDAEPLMRIKIFRVGTTHVRITNPEHVDAMNLIMARRYPGALPPPRGAAAEKQAQEARRPTTFALARTEKQARQAFYTPAEVADKLVEAAHLDTHSRVLEPSAGEGAIVRALLRARVRDITAVENDPHGIEMLGHLARRVEQEGEPGVTVLPLDFFTALPVEFGSYDAVVMNPPFAGAQEVEHVLRAWRFVKPGGVLVSVMSASAATRRDGRYGVLTKFLAEHKAEIEKLPDGAFEEAGTGVSTIMVKVRKPGESA